MQKTAPSNMQPAVVGVDVGGTKVLASLVDGMGSLLGRIYRPTIVDSPEATLDGIARVVEQAIKESGVPRQQVQGVGLGLPGLIDPVRGIGVASVNLNWRDVPVKAELEARLGLPCVIENDVKAAALGEARYGAGKGLESLVFLVIGTGIAAGIVLDNKVYRGPTGMAGEIGHAKIERDGPPCKCGGNGCFEALASGPAIAARAARKLSSGRPSLLAKAGEGLTAEDVFQAASMGDALAQETAEEVGEYIAFAIQFLALAYDPRVVVLGGGVPQAGKPFLDPVLESLDRQAKQNWVFREMYRPGFLRVSQLGSDIGVLGAAALVAP
jgi:glucokinase-like ROK family protein